MANEKTPVPRFENMNELSEAYRFWPANLPLVLNDEVSPEILAQVWNKETFKAAKEKCNECQKNWIPRLNPTECVALLSYEDNAKKLEGKLGMSALHMWFMAYEQLQRTWRDEESAALTKEEALDVLKKLILSGPDMEAAYASAPELPTLLMRNHFDKELVLLAESGYPLNRLFHIPDEYEYSFKPFIAKAVGILSHEFDSDPEKSGTTLRLAINAALAQGASMEDRDVKGLTILGSLVENLRNSTSKRYQAIVPILLEMGADPLNISLHPIAATANVSVALGAAVAKMQRLILEKELSAVKSAKEKDAKESKDMLQKQGESIRLPGSHLSSPQGEEMLASGASNGAEAPKRRISAL